MDNIFKICTPAVPIETDLFEVKRTENLVAPSATFCLGLTSTRVIYVSPGPKMQVRQSKTPCQSYPEHFYAAIDPSWMQLKRW